MKNSIYKFLALFIATFFLVILSFNNPSITLNYILFVNASSLLLYILLSLKIQSSLFSPSVIIVFCLYLFHSGQLWLYPFDIKSYEYLFDINTTTNLKSIYILSTKMLIVLSYSTLLFSKKIKRRSTKINVEKIEISKTLYVFIIVAYFIMLYFDIERAGQVMSLGYGEGFKYQSTFAFTLDRFFIIINICLIIANSNNNKNLWIIIISILFRGFLVMLLVGNRGSTIISLLLYIFILYHNTVFFKKNNKRIFQFAPILCILLLPYISFTRQDIFSTTNFISFLIENNPIVYFLAEFGGTIKTFGLGLDYLLAKGNNFHLFLDSNLALFPLSEKIFNYSNISIGGMLNDINGIRGLGGSILAQLILSFGDGLLMYCFLIIFGYFISFVSYELINNTNLSISKFLLLICTFSGLLTSVRGEWYDIITMIKMCLYALIIGYLYKSIFRR